MEDNTAKALADLTVLDTAAKVVRLGDLWQEAPAALVFVRHFGCMLCKEQVAELGGFAGQLAAAGLRLFLIGNGSAAQAATFAQESATPFPLFTDPRLGTFKAAGLERSIGSVVNIGTLKSGLRALKAGHFQSSVRGDAWQEGGAFVIAPGDRLLFAQRSKAGGDHVDPRELIRAIAG